VRGGLRPEITREEQDRKIRHTPRDVVHEKCASSAPIVAARDRSAYCSNWFGEGMSTAQKVAAPGAREEKRRDGFANLNRSCPAAGHVRPHEGTEVSRGKKVIAARGGQQMRVPVSQICSLIFLPMTSIMRVPNSTPIVCGESGMTAPTRLRVRPKIPTRGR
jgi:hypothetical protein